MYCYDLMPIHCYYCNDMFLQHLFRCYHYLIHLHHHHLLLLLHHFHQHRRHRHCYPHLLLHSHYLCWYPLPRFLHHQYPPCQIYHFLFIDGGDVGTGDSESIFTYKCWSTPRGNNTKEDDGGEESNLCTIVARSSYGIRTHNLAISSHNALPIELSYFLLLCNCFNFIC